MVRDVDEKLLGGAKSGQVDEQSLIRGAWKRLGEKLQSRFVFTAANGVAQPWLHLLALQGPGPCRLGCILCAKVKLPGAMAAFAPATLERVRSSKLVRHEQSPMHQKAVQAVTRPAAQRDSAVHAPSGDEFQAVWRHLRKRRFGEVEGGTKVFRHKARKIEFCLAEALRERQRDTLKRARCISFSQDAAETRHLVRFASVDSNMTSTTGVLGMLRDGAAGHKAILRATDAVIRQASTPLHGAPRKPCDTRSPQTVCDDGLYKHIRENVILWNSDAGPDELLAGSEALVWAPSAQDVRPLLPNLRFVNRDKAHASRRVIKRPWFADPELRSVYTEFVAMMSVIQHSHVLRKWYVEYQAAGAAPGCETTLTVQPSLAWCAPRFDSSAKPLGIAVLTIDAVLLTAIRNVTERKHSENYAVTLRFLEFVTGPMGTRRLCLAGMIADAARECLQFTRELDAEALIRIVTNVT